MRTRQGLWCIAPLAGLLWAVMAADALARGGGGCFLPDTPILRADGTTAPIAGIQPGERVLAFDGNGVMTTATVQTVITRDVAEIVELTAGGVLVRVTPEHPFYVGGGQFRTVAALHPGDRVFLCDWQRMRAETITRIDRRQQTARVYNLRTDQPHTYFAGGFAVHNKGGGCFPAGTRIATPSGDAAIETLRPGDTIIGVEADGSLVHGCVQRTVRLLGKPSEIRTSAGVLCATAEHPVRLADGTFLSLGELTPGKQVCRADAATVHPVAVLGPGAPRPVQEVFNLEVEAPHTFIAEGFVVHNKGGGGGGGGFHGGSGFHGNGGSGGNGDPVPVLIFFCAMVVIVSIVKVVQSRQAANADLDYCYSAGAVAGKAGKTARMLEFLARQDPLLRPAELQKTVQATFLKLQECWTARDYAPMQPLLMADLYAQHCAQIAGMKRNHEINVIASLQVLRIDLVNVRYMNKPEQSEFTALITARARDYYKDDRTGNFVRGDGAAATFQEFWTFQRQGSGWVLREIEQTRESDALKADNFVEMFTDQQMRQVYADQAAAAAGPAGPWVGGTLETKATRTERLLNFLSQIDKHWGRDEMLERARQVFTRVKMTEENGDAASVSADLFPDAATHLQAELADWKGRGLSTEYRNFCVRKVEIILVRNFNDNSRDEFTTRISAHAQVIVRRADGTETRHDEDVAAFVEFWTFGWLDGQWKLKEVLPPAAGQRLLQKENTDEGSSGQMMQWYDTKNRAV